MPILTPDALFFFDGQPGALALYEELARQLLSEYPSTQIQVKKTQIGQIIFEERKEKNPCALCAKMRRGALNNLCVELGCNKVALGHHREDALETLMLSLLHEGRLHTFAPVTRLDKTGLTVLRPLIYAPEWAMAKMARELRLPVVSSPCPANGNTERAEMKALLDSLSRKYPGARERMLAALKNTEQYGLWDKI